MVLADARYARERARPTSRHGTLTGAMVLAMGDLYAAWRQRRGLADQIVDAGNARRHLWPLHRRYRRYVNSNFADMKTPRFSGSPALAAEFLREFSGKAPIDLRGGVHPPLARDYLSQQGGTGTA
jgi:leucyl aminopeptidase